MAVWIKTYNGKKYDDFHDCVNAIWQCKCSACGWVTGQQGVKFNYCPICGVKMENTIYNTDLIPKTKLEAIIEEIKASEMCNEAKKSVLGIINDGLEDWDGEEDFQE